MFPSVFMLIPLAIVFGIGVAFYFFSRWRTRRLLQSTEAEDADFLPGQPLLFDNPRNWVAIKATTPQEVQAALGLQNAITCSWSDGLEHAAGEKLFLTPAIEGWVLVLGSSLPEPGDDIDMFFRFIQQISQRCGLVIYFQAERVFDHHAWVKAINGRIVRAYAWADEALWNQGDLTQAERDLRLRCEPYSAPRDHVPPAARDAARFNCDRIPALAARWSIDPKSIGPRWLQEQFGIVGQLPEVKPH